MAGSKINPGSKSNPDTGFGNQTNIGGRFVNKDGSFNLTYKLFSDSINYKSFIDVISNLDGTELLNSYQVKYINKDTLKFINLGIYDPIVINLTEVNKGVFYLVKRN